MCINLICLCCLLLRLQIKNSNNSFFQRFACFEYLHCEQTEMRNLKNRERFFYRPCITRGTTKGYNRVLFRKKERQNLEIYQCEFEFSNKARERENRKLHFILTSNINMYISKSKCVG